MVFNLRLKHTREPGFRLNLTTHLIPLNHTSSFVHEYLKNGGQRLQVLRIMGTGCIRVASPGRPGNNLVLTASFIYRSSHDHLQDWADSGTLLKRTQCKGLTESMLARLNIFVCVLQWRVIFPLPRREQRSHKQHVRNVCEASLCS